MKVLIVRQDKLGDVLLTTPLPTAIKRSSPNTEVHVMVQPAWRDIFDRHPHVDDVVTTTYKPGLPEYPGVIGTLKRGGYDAVILCKEDSGAHTTCAAWAGIPARVGFTHKGYGKKLTRNLFDEFSEVRHEVDWLIRMGEAAIGGLLEGGPLVFNPTLSEQAKADELLDGLDGFFLVAPTTGGTSRSWGAAQYRDVTQKLIERTELTAIITGAQGESEAEQVAADLPDALNLVGQLTLGELAAVQKRARFLVSGSTGAMHLAAAQATPIMLIETRIDADKASQRWAPWQTEHEIALPEVFANGESRDPSVDEVLALSEKLFRKIGL